MTTLTFGYGTTDNNGNVRQQTISRPGVLTATQYYRYDGGNRLAIATENAEPTAFDGCPGGVVWCRDYSYDAYGNGALIDSPGAPASQFAPTALSQFSALTNRIASVPGAANPAYDAVGNLVSHAGVGVNLAYDANNKMTSFTGTNPSLQEEGGYAYDGDGRRVRRQSTIAGTSITTTYVYDAFGNLAAEYSTQATETPDTYYRTTDHLGSTRLVTRANGTIKECLDFLPFGEPLDDSIANRSQSCYGDPDEGPFKQKFTGKERDDESPLDYFGVRYFSASLGRFTSADDPLLDQQRQNPQSWNLFNYGRNSPLRFFDPTGAKCIQTDAGGLADDGTGGGCASAGVDSNGRITDPDSVDAIDINVRATGYGQEVYLNGSLVFQSGAPRDYATEFLLLGMLRGLAGFGRAGVAGGAAGVAESSIWNVLPPTVRGGVIEQMLGGNLPRTFPVIDKFLNGVATSIKSLDLRAVSHLDPVKLERTLLRHVDSVAGFQYGTLVGVEVSGVTGRVLQVAIPEGAATAAQQAVFSRVAAQAAQRGVQVIISPIP